MNKIFGGLDWGRENGGRLTTLERVRYTYKLVQLRFRAKARQDNASRALFSDLSKIKIPDSPLILAIHSQVDAFEPWLFHHSIRTFFWGTLLGKMNGARIDSEKFYLSALLHDLALTKNERPPRGKCFAIHGGERAYEILVGHGYSASSSHEVADAISRHLNLDDRTASPEARALQMGAAFDVIGKYYRQLDEKTIQQVLETYPRLHMKSCLCPLLKSEAENASSSRIAVLVKAGFLESVKNSPFAE